MSILYRRRDFIQAAAAVTAGTWAAGGLEAADVRTAQFMEKRRSETLRYIESMRFKDEPYGRRHDIRKALLRAENHVWEQQNADGGFTWIRGTKFEYGHPLLGAPVNGSGMFPTWFRTLSLAYLGKALPESRTGSFDWHFSNCPGIQFFFP
jgi:hypothetical protein